MISALRSTLFRADHSRKAERAARPSSDRSKTSEGAKPSVGIITIGQSTGRGTRRWQRRLGGNVEIVGRGALDGLTSPEIEALAPGSNDSVLETRLRDGSQVFLARRKILPLVQHRIEEVERLGAAVTVLLCTGSFPTLRATRTLVKPNRVIRGVLRAIERRGPLGIVTPSSRHVPQVERYWRRYDPIVVPLSPFRENDAASVEGAIATLKAGDAALVVMDCMAFGRNAGTRIRAALGVPVIVPDRLVARVAAELVGV